jgi:hypothetical protein
VIQLSLDIEKVRRGPQYGNDERLHFILLALFAKSIQLFVNWFVFWKIWKGRQARRPTPGTGESGDQS